MLVEEVRMRVDSNPIEVDLAIAQAHFGGAAGFLRIQVFAPASETESAQLVAVFGKVEEARAATRDVRRGMMGAPGSSRIIVVSTGADVELLLGTQRPGSPPGVLWGPHGQRLEAVCVGREMREHRCGCGAVHFGKTLVERIVFSPQSCLLSLEKSPWTSEASYEAMWWYQAEGRDPTHGTVRHDFLEEVMSPVEIRSVLGADVA